MGDIVGRLFREFAVTLSVTIVVSAIVSLTLTPMMCAKLLHHKPESQQGRLYRFSEHVFQSIIDFYGRTLRFVLRHQFTTLLVFLATLGLTVWLFIIIPKGFFPVQDTGVILGVSEGPQNISFDAMSQRQQALSEVILKDPDVESLSSFIGIDGTNVTLNSGRVQINLKPIKGWNFHLDNLKHLILFDGQFQLYEGDRTASASDVIRRLQTKLDRVPGITLFMQPVQDLTVEDRVSRTQFQYSLEDPDPKELAYWVPRFVEKLQSLPELRDVASDQQDQGLQAKLVINRDTAGRLGITPQMIDDALYDAYGQRQVSTMFTQLNQYHVVLEVKPEFRDDPADLSSIYIRSSTGGKVPIDSIARIDQTTTPLAISHQGQFPAVTISFNLAPDAALGDAVRAIDAARAEIGMPMSVQADFEGTARAFQASLANEWVLILAALVTVYIVLGVLYESYIHPITILSTLPSAGVGALLALMLCGNDFSVIALIGIILLIGIVKKNAIMMIDFALDAQRNDGKSPDDAIFQACLLRLRPILMTTMAALLAGVPLALGSGTGSELRRPLGISMIGGLIFSQVLTLYTTPVIYLAFDRLAQRVKNRFGHQPAQETPVQVRPESVELA
jgi:multidrug efflux pump